jgi:hypothetical protein
METRTISVRSRFAKFKNQIAPIVIASMPIALLYIRIIAAFQTSCAGNHNPEAGTLIAAAAISPRRRCPGRISVAASLPG